MNRFAAVDLGASSGRVIVGTVTETTLTYEEVHRFSTEPVRRGTRLHWDFELLFTNVCEGLQIAASGGPLTGIGIDSWGVDYVLFDANGALVDEPFCYRDERTDNREAGLYGLSPEDLYNINGLQHLPFTTIYQLAAEDHERLARAATLLQIPDAIAFMLTGRAFAERTNASTTGLLDATTKQWSTEVVAALRISAQLLPSLVDPGSMRGSLRPECQVAFGIGANTQVINVGSHDTASAVMAIPAASKSYAYISCGTWGLVGVELDTPVLTEQSRAANFTNEFGVDNQTRYLRNVMGLWLLQQCEATWAAASGSTGPALSTAELIAAAADLPPSVATFDVDQNIFLAPGDMPKRIADECHRVGLPIPTTPAEFTRLLIDSLAAKFAATIDEAATLSGQRVDVVHIVGGGSRNALLCQLTADACGLPVVAGPVEATAIGNLLVQARAAGAVHGDRAHLRALVRSTHDLRTYEPAET